MNESIENALLFLRMARTDRGAVDLLLPGGDEYLLPALFHVQQAAEKTLKSVQVLHAPPVRKSHDLVFLWQCLSEAGYPPPVSLHELALLNPFAVTMRYDDTLLPAIDPVAAIASIDRLLAWADDIICRASRQ